MHSPATVRLPSGHFLGRTVSLSELSGLVLIETSYPQSAELSRHAHAHASFCTVLTGGFTEHTGSSRHLCGPSTVIFRPADEPHADRFHPLGGRCFNVAIQPNWLDHAQRRTAVVPNAPVYLDLGPLVWLLRRLYGEFREMDECSPLAIEGLVLEALAATSRYVRHPRARVPRWLAEAADLLRDRFAQKVTLTQIAGHVGIHPVHLAREFRRHYHVTLGQYQRRLRVEYACRQLTDSGAPLVQIALEAGFSHQGHFARTFKRLTGVTPLEYRRHSNSR